MLFFGKYMVRINFFYLKMYKYTDEMIFIKISFVKGNKYSM